MSTKSSTQDIEEGRALAPKFDADGLVTCVATDAKSGDVLMVAHMNAEALQKTIATGEGWYFSRSRKKLWRKGEAQALAARRGSLDCDQDSVWIKVGMGRRRVPHRPALVLLSRGAVRPAGAVSRVP